jgi:hypothetical protein
MSAGSLTILRMQTGGWCDGLSCFFSLTISISGDGWLVIAFPVFLVIICPSQQLVAQQSDSSHKLVRPRYPPALFSQLFFHRSSFPFFFFPAQALLCTLTFFKLHRWCLYQKQNCPIDPSTKAGFLVKRWMCHPNARAERWSWRRRPKMWWMIPLL